MNTGRTVTKKRNKRGCEECLEDMSSSLVDFRNRYRNRPTGKETLDEEIVII
jgi:hypothetical protein